MCKCNFDQFWRENSNETLFVIFREMNECWVLWVRIQTTRSKVYQVLIFYFGIPQLPNFQMKIVINVTINDDDYLVSTEIEKKKMFGQKTVMCNSF